MSSLLAASPVDDAEGGWLILTTLALVAVALGSLTVVRYVPANNRLLVSRKGQPPRVAGPGVTAQIPLVSRTRMVSLEPMEIEVVARAVSRDGIALLGMLAVEIAIVDPGLVLDVDDPVEKAATAVEKAVSTTLSAAAMEELGAVRDELEAELAARTSVKTRHWGVAVLSARVREIDARIIAPPGPAPR
ncbi:MAG TPA: SPFH domain-containing protein [Nocardioidaceae bacterium]|nr:SPFH domain-containing protein [Nocardioidaceae bacterium]